MHHRCDVLPGSLLLCATRPHSATVSLNMSPTFSAFVSPALPSLYRHRCRVTANSSRPRWRAATDWYKLLDVPSDADASAIKRAYRRAALQNHPDVSKAANAKERFLRIQEAYAVLSDPSKRATYDRSRRTGGGFDSSVWSGGNAGGGFNVGEFSKKWRERNPMPEDLNDSLGSIFGDLFKGVTGAVGGGGGIMEDFVEFLERGLVGEQDGLRQVLKSRDEDVLRAEVEDSRFVLGQLRTRRDRLEEEGRSLTARAEDWNRRAERAGRDYMTRDAARTRERELRTEGGRLEGRARKTTELIEKQENRLKKIESRLEEVSREGRAARNVNASWEGRNEKGNGNAAGGGVRKAGKSEREIIEEELEKMKKELGL